MNSCEVERCDYSSQNQRSALYDCAPVFIMNPRFHHAGHAVNGQINLNYITAAHLQSEAIACGMRPDEAREVVEETIESVGSHARMVGIDPALKKIPSKIAKRCVSLGETI